MAQGKKSSSKVQPKSAQTKIAAKNYIYALLVLVGGILIVLYIFEWVNVKKEEKLMTSYLLSSNTIDSSINDLNSLEQILKEVPSSYFLYISYTQDEEVYNFEKALKRVIDNYNLSDSFYYVDLTELKNNNENYIIDVEKTLNIDLERIPVIIYVKNGVIEENNILDGINDTMVKISDLENLLDIYEFEPVK